MFIIRWYNFLFSIWMKFDRRIRFLLVGGANTVVSYALFVVFLFLFGRESYQLALISSWILSSFVSFFNQKVYVWCTKGNWIKEYIKCCITWGIGCVMNSGILEVMIRIFPNVYIAQIISIFIVAILSYFLMKHFAFVKVDEIVIAKK